MNYENWLLLVAANTCVQWGKGWLTERKVDVIPGESCCHDCPYPGSLIMLWGSPSQETGLCYQVRWDTRHLKQTIVNGWSAAFSY